MQGGYIISLDSLFMSNTYIIFLLGKNNTHNRKEDI
jgi:hypothetical protein